MGDCDVIPVADPNDLSTTQKLLKAQMLYEMRGQGFNDMEIKRRLLEAMQIDDVDKVLKAPKPPPDPKLVLEMKKLELEQSKLKFEVLKWDTERKEIFAKVEKTMAQAIESMAKAEAAEAGPQIEMYKTQLDAVVKSFSEANKQIIEKTKAINNGNNQAGS